MALSIAAEGNLISVPCPSSDVSIAGLSGNPTHTMNIWRSVEGRRVQLRSGDRAVLGTSTVVSDWECPFATDVTYQVTEYAADGSVIDTAQSSPFSFDPGYVWISDPLNPSASTRVIGMDAAALGSFSYVRSGDVVSLIGSDTPIAATGIRSVASSIPLDMLAYTVGQRVSILSVLQYADPFLIRTPGTTKFEYLPRLAYCSAPTLAVAPWGAEASGCTIQLTVDLVAAPSASIVVPPRSYGNLLEEASSYGDLLPIYRTYLKMARGS